MVPDGPMGSRTMDLGTRLAGKSPPMKAVRANSTIILAPRQEISFAKLTLCILEVEKSRKYFVLLKKIKKAYCNQSLITYNILLHKIYHV